MKILIVNSVIDYGSTGRICIDAAKNLLEKGHEVKIAYGRDKAVFKDNSIIGYRIGSKASVYMHGIFTRLFDAHGLGSIAATKKFIRWANKFGPDVVWIHNIHGYYINYKIFFKWLGNKKIKVVWTLHDCWSFTGHCTHFEFIKCFRWQTCCYKCPQTKQYPTAIISSARRNLLKKKKAFTSLSNLTIVTPSVWLSNLVLKSFLQKYPTKVINNGIDLNSFYFEKNGFREKYNIDNKKVILCISSIWSDRKGLYDVFSMSKLLNENEVVVIVGRLNFKKTEDLPNNVILIERTNDIDELRQIYSSCDVMFNPTYEDTYSNINMEALSCNTPVVCYKSGGAYEMLDKDFVVPQGSFKEALLVMRKIFNGSLKFNKPKQDFSSKKTILEYEKLLTNR